MSTQNEPLNTAPIQQFISQVKSADASQVKEVKRNNLEIFFSGKKPKDQVN